MTATERSVVWIDLGGKYRLAVVLHVEADIATVIAVTGTERNWIPHVRVARKSPAGRALRLTKPTYFYADNVIQWPLSRPVQFAQGRRCVPELFDALNRLVAQLSPVLPMRRRDS